MLRPTIDWTTAVDWENYSANYLAQVVADLDIATAGAYTFRLLSDDGSKLLIDGNEIIDHDGVHGATTKDGDVTLAAGSHALEIRYFQVGGPQRLQLQWKRPGQTTFETVPTSVLSVEGGGARVVSPGVKECQSLSDLPGDGSPLTGVHPSFTLGNLRPDAFRPDVSGIAWYPDGSAAVLTWGAAQTSSNGKLYKVTNLQGDVNVANVTYTEIATGLQEPQGVAVVDGATYVSTKAGLDKLVDANGDGFFEGRDRLASWPYANNYHEFAFGLPYRDGYFYVALSGALDRAGLTTLPQPSPDRGTVAKVNKDTGAIEYIAGGLRTPNGINFASGRATARDRQSGRLGSDEQARGDQAGRLLQHVHDLRGPGHRRERPWALRQPAGHAPGRVDAAQRDRELPVDPGRHGGRACSPGSSRSATSPTAACSASSWRRSTASSRARCTG